MKDVKRVRPIGISILAMCLLWFAVWSGLRLIAAFFFWKTLEEYNAYPLYISVSGGVWFITGLLLAWGIWRGKAWGWVAAIGIVVGYSFWYWFDRLVLQRPHANWLFTPIANIVILFFFLYILFSRKTRCYFHRDAYERKPKTSKTA